MTTHHGAYELDADASRVDLDVVWGFLHHDAYWAKTRTRDQLDAQVASAWRVIGAYDSESKAMVGFARAFSDGVASAYLADVFVLPEARGRGLGLAIVREMIEEGPGAGFRWGLHTADAHDLYSRFGFRAPDTMYLERPARGPAEEPSGHEGEAPEETGTTENRPAPLIRSAETVELDARLKRLLKDRGRPGSGEGVVPDGVLGAEAGVIHTMVGSCLTAWEREGSLTDERRSELKQAVADLDLLVPQLTRRREAQYVGRLREIAQTLSDLAEIS